MDDDGFGGMSAVNMALINISEMADLKSLDRAENGSSGTSLSSPHTEALKSYGWGP